MIIKQPYNKGLTFYLKNDILFWSATTSRQLFLNLTTMFVNFDEENNNVVSEETNPEVEAPTTEETPVEEASAEDTSTEKAPQA